MMTKAVRLLLVEDVEDDALLLVRELRKGGIDPDYARVETAEELKAAREIIGRLGIPVIFMTGHDDEETVGAAWDLKPLAFLVKPLEVNRLKELLVSS